MKLQVVTVDATVRPRLWDVQDIDTPDPIAAMEVRGFPHEGMSRNDGPLREELRGQPTFKGLCGPMWGGTDKATGEPILRYESWAAYEILSTWEDHP